MNRSRRFTVFVPVVWIFAALSLSAMAQEPPKKPPAKGPAVQQKGPGPQVGHGPPGHGGPASHAVEHHPMGRDPGHWTDRDRYAWGHGNWRPQGCHFGRCGYWWWADGYWYFYDHPMEGHRLRFPSTPIRIHRHRHRLKDMPSRHRRHRRLRQARVWSGAPSAAVSSAAYSAVH